MQLRFALALGSIERGLQSACVAVVLGRPSRQRSKLRAVISSAERGRIGTAGFFFLDSRRSPNPVYDLVLGDFCFMDCTDCMESIILSKICYAMHFEPYNLTLLIKPVLIPVVSPWYPPLPSPPW